MAKRANRWAQDEIARLKTHYEELLSIGEIAICLGRTPSAVRTRIGILELTRSGRSSSSEFDQLVKKARILGVKLESLPRMQTAVSVLLHLATRFVSDTSEIESACNLQQSNCTKIIAYLELYGSIFIDRFVSPREVSLNRAVFTVSPIVGFPLEYFQGKELITPEERESMLETCVRKHDIEPEDRERLIAFVVRQYRYALAGDIGFDRFEKLFTE